MEVLIAMTTSFSVRIYEKRGGKKLVEVVQSTLQDSLQEKGGSLVSWLDLRKGLLLG